MKQILDDYAQILNVTPEKPLLEKKPSETKAKKKEKALKNIAASSTSSEKPELKEKNKLTQSQLH